MTMNLNVSSDSATKDAGVTVPSADAPSQKSSSTATPSADAVAASSNDAATTDPSSIDLGGRKLLEQGRGSVTVSRLGDTVLIGIDYNGSTVIRLDIDTALLFAEQVKKSALARIAPRSNGAADAARAIDRARTGGTDAG